MAMSRKDYRAIAAVLREEYRAVTEEDYPYDPVRRQAAQDVIAAVANRLCPVFRADNSAFDTSRFMEAALGDRV